MIWETRANPKRTRSPGRFALKSGTYGVVFVNNPICVGILIRDIVKAYRQTLYLAVAPLTSHLTGMKNKEQEQKYYENVAPLTSHLTGMRGCKPMPIEMHYLKEVAPHKGRADVNKNIWCRWQLHFVTPRERCVDVKIKEGHSIRLRDNVAPCERCVDVNDT